jgi:hypothetical protein
MSFVAQIAPFAEDGSGERGRGHAARVGDSGSQRGAMPTEVNAQALATQANA